MTVPIRLSKRIALGVLIVLGMALPATYPRQAGAQSLDCKPTVTRSVEPTSIALGETVEVRVEVDEGCPDVRLDHHYTIILQPWVDAAGTDAARKVVQDFLSRSDLGASRVGIVPGNAVDLDIESSRITDDPAEWAPALAGYMPTSNGVPLHKLIRKARDLYVDADMVGRARGKRHIVVIGHAAAPEGFASSAEYELELADESAIDARYFCVGGGCEPLEGMSVIELPDADAVALALNALQDSEARLALHRFGVAGRFAESVDYVFDSASPPADEMGRSFYPYISWRPSPPGDRFEASFRLKPLESSESLQAVGPVTMVGLSNIGESVNAGVDPWELLEVAPGSGNQSDCKLRALAEAGPDPSMLHASAQVSFTLQADCAAGRRPIDVILAIDRSASMLRGSRLVEVQSAARSFVNAAEMDEGVARVALVTFGTGAQVHAPLDSDRQSLLDAIDEIEPAGETYLRHGIRLSREMLGARRAAALPVIVLLSDGDTQIRADALQAAYWAHLEGIRMVAVCVTGTRVCDPDFAKMANPSSYFRSSAGGEDLSDFYRDIAISLGQPDFDRLVVAMNPHAAFEYVSGPAGHNRPSLDREGRYIWQQADPLFGRSLLHFPLETRAVGRWPIAQTIEASWTDSFGGVGEASIHVPSLTVLPPEDEGPCRLEPYDRTAPSSPVQPAEPMTVRTTLGLRCEPTRESVEVLLVLDHSSSMRGDRIEATRSGVRSLLDRVQGESVRFGLVAFSDAILSEVPLTDDREAIWDALVSVDPDGVTNIGQAINRGRALLQASRPNSRRIIVLMTDGRNSVDPETIRRAAEDAKEEEGIQFMAVCAGGDCDPVLQDVPSRPAYYFDAPDEARLMAVFERLAEVLVEVVPSEIVLAEQPGPWLPIIPQASQPEESFGPNPYEWHFGLPPKEGITLRQSFLPQRPGRHPLSLWARLEYQTLQGVTGTVHLPPNEIEVLGGAPEDPAPTALPLVTPGPPTASPTAGVSPSATPQGTEVWGRVYLPWGMVSRR